MLPGTDGPTSLDQARAGAATALGAATGQSSWGPTGFAIVSSQSAAERLLDAGGELLTLVRGIGFGDDLLPEITRRVHARFPMVDVELLDGGQSRYPLLLGLE